MDERLDWIRANAMPLAAVEAGHGFADLERLRGIIGDARIVSLGEATHGTREFFQLKHRLLEFCVSELGFTIFGIEANYPECLRINDYVLHGRGNPSHGLAGTRFWTWDTQEVLALIEWMRTWNEAHDRKVKFYGFDMQFPTEAALGVLDYLRRVAADLAAACEAPLWPLSDDVSADRLRLLPEATRTTAQASVAHVLEAFARERPAWVAVTGELEWQLARLNAVVLDQSMRLRLAGPHDMFAWRDTSMAENVRALLDVEGPQAKAVLWAHNGHVAKSTAYFTDDKAPIANMGSCLAQMFGRQHMVVGFAFNQGSFQAIELGRGLVDHTVPPAPESSFDHVLAAAGLPAFLLDMGTAPAAGPVSDWLASKPPSRSIGAVYSADSAQDYQEPTIDPRLTFDVLAFIETTTAARPNETRTRPSWSTREPADTATNLALAAGSEVPDGWTWSGTPRPHSHRVSLVDDRSPAGGRTVCIARTMAPWRWGEGQLEQTFLAESRRGRRVRFAASVRAEVQGPGSGAHLFLELRPERPTGSKWTMPPSAVAMVDRGIRSPHWQTCAVEIDVPQETHAITIVLALAGNGTAWFGDLELASV
jgi:erythromycin esterase